MDIYISTDSNEVKAIIEPVKPNIDDGVCRDYNLSRDKIRIDGKNFSITNLPVVVGREIQAKSRLTFNPISVISEQIDHKRYNTLIKKLINEGLFVSVSNGRGVENYSPNKYNGGGYMNGTRTKNQIA